MEINFKSLSPTYERKPVISSVEELYAMGCSSELVSNISIGDGYNPRIPPEDWFWADRERLGADGPWIDELYQIAGGGFVNLPLAEQAKLLNLPVREIKLEKSMEYRGRWVLNDGRVGTIEEAALDAILLPDELGFNDEGDFVQIIHSMIVQIANIAFEKAFDLEQASRVKPRTQDHLIQMREALNFSFGRVTISSRSYGLGLTAHWANRLTKRDSGNTSTNLETIFFHGLCCILSKINCLGRDILT